MKMFHNTGVHLHSCLGDKKRNRTFNQAELYLVTSSIVNFQNRLASQCFLEELKEQKAFFPLFSGKLSHNPSEVNL